MGTIFLKRAKTIIIDLKILIYLQPFIIEAVIYINNLLPSQNNPEGKSLQEIFAKKINFLEGIEIPYIKHLRSYFYNVYYFIKLEKRVKGDKFYLRLIKGEFIRYSNIYSRIYKIWNPTIGEIVKASAVRFVEKED